MNACCICLSYRLWMSFHPTYFTLLFLLHSHHHQRRVESPNHSVSHIFENYANYFSLSPSSIYIVKPISTSIVHKPKQLVTESQITLSCEVEGSVPDTDIKWTQNNRVFERGTVRESWTFFFINAFSFKSRKHFFPPLLCVITFLLFIVGSEQVFFSSMDKAWTDCNVGCDDYF